MIENIKKKIDSLFKEANYETFYFDSNLIKRNKFCFDSLVKKDNTVFIVKLFPNIDNLNRDIIKAIKDLSLLLKSKPILIGIKNRYQELEDNFIYIREDLPFITVNTLENILTHARYPFIIAKRGGGVIFLDGELMKTLREEKNITRKEMSERIGVTKRTISSYENESMRPSQNIAEQILEILEDHSIFRNINLFNWHIKVNFTESSLHEGELNNFESHLQDVFKDIGISTFWYKKGEFPFELTISSKKYNPYKEFDFYPIFSGVSGDSNDKKINKINLTKLLSFAKIFEKNALFIINNNFKVPDFFKNTHIPIIKIKKLENIDNEDEFIDLIQEN